MLPDETSYSVDQRQPWIAWLLGAALLAAVIGGALHFSEGRAFARTLTDANPKWLLLAVALQAVTYLAQAEVFRIAPAAAGTPLPAAFLYELSLAKVFLDQALPSAGMSSAVVMAQAFQARGVSRAAAAAGVVINIASYHAAYVVTLLLALTTTSDFGRLRVLVLAFSALFLTFAGTLTIGVLALSGRRGLRAAYLRKLPGLRRVVNFVVDADASMARNPRLLAEATAWQVGIFLLDTATMCVLVQSLGGTAPLPAVFASFMVSSVFRTMGVLPGGLGTYEAASVLTLRLAGVSTPVALSATLMFRGLGFWLPMLPGLWCSRRVTASPPRLQAAGPEPYWVTEPGEIAARLGSGPDGLSQAEAERRLRSAGPSPLRGHRSRSRLDVVWAQVRNPLLLILVFAASASALSGEWIDATIVLVIVVASVAVGYSREYSAQTAVAALQAQVQVHTTVVRDGRTSSVPLEEVVPGDIVLLSAGALIPGDGVILEATDCFVSEAVLTGESFPIEKRPGPVSFTAPLRERTNSLFLGTSVRSGTARCLIVRTGPATEFGAVAARLSLRPPETEFDRGIRRFGYLMTIAMLALVLLVFVAHMLRGRPPIETLLFSVALAVGLSPELLPAVLSVSLARGAQMMARHGVIVRRLNAIENLGSMNILCTDKTGTLTEGVVQLEGAYDPSGVASTDVLRLGACNAALETGLNNPLDEAILQALRPDLSGLRKAGEIPFDFVRKRVSVIVDDDHGRRLITKGAFEKVLDACTRVGNGLPLDATARTALFARYDAWAGQGIRVLAVAERTLEPSSTPDREEEQNLRFAGFLTFLDRPKHGASDTIADLARLGVAVKLITGDSKLVAQHVAALVGLRAERVLTGQDLLALNNEALWHVAERTDLFVEVDPNQKERIILALKRMGHVVGFLGDGVNDAPAMHAADTSLSVDDAVDVAREAADFVLLERNLDVIRRGIEEGRRTFANTLKYVLTTTSANLGNMLSMAAASLFLPFLPLLAGQILLNNFLSDIPAIGIADDSVDSELVERPERWNIRFIGRFMLTFGMLSSAFDGLMFAALLFVFQVAPDLFRTAWFVESLLTELAVALVVRTRRPFYRSRPGSVLLVSTVLLVPLALLLPYFPFVGALGFVPMPTSLVATICGITLAYVMATEVAKKWFYRGTQALPRVRGRRPLAWRTH